MCPAALLVLMSAAAAPPAEPWTPVAPGVLRSPGNPAAHALVADGRALLIDWPAGLPLDGLKAAGASSVEAVLLTHHHRDTAGGAAAAKAAGIPVRGPKSEAGFLRPDEVAKYWTAMLPVPSSRLGYLMLPAGIEGVAADLEDGAEIAWRGWTVMAVAAPGHTRGHLAFAARRGADGSSLLFCGDALAGDGVMWSPYTTDWDHWTDAGLAPASATLRRLAGLKPDLLLPAHGPPIKDDIPGVLSRTADRLAEAGYLKSFERFTKERLGKPPAYRFLVPRETIIGLKGRSDRFTEVSEHLFILDNTYVLTSKSGHALIVDLYGKGIIDKVKALAAERKIAGFDALLISHAHYDHYLSVHDWPDGPLPVWALDRVAEPLEQPMRFYAPFLEKRPLTFARKPRDGGTLEWREYRFTFHHFPGQTDFTQAVEVVIDGRKCLFTADNWYHHDQFAGVGGWMALNRAPPSGYARSARKVLELAPDWILAEHGGPFEFSAEDFRRRVQWAEAAGKALDAICPSGDHRRDWDLHRLRVEPLVSAWPTGAAPPKLKLIATNPAGADEEIRFTVEGRGLVADTTVVLRIPAGRTAEAELPVSVIGGGRLPAGRQVFAVRAVGRRGVEPADLFFAVDVAAAPR
jgi:glyoxylase-like metal-dependent hydrolase (beta-lactamase superfamily II)